MEQKLPRNARSVSPGNPELFTSPGLHHCVAGSVEVLAGVLTGYGASAADYGRFLPWATAGNIIGGVIFAWIKYSHAIRARHPP